MTFLSNYISRYVKKRQNYMKLIAIKSIDSHIICEFNEELNIDGKLIKIPINKIFNDKKIQSHISPSTLLLIGTLFGAHKNLEKSYKIKQTDIIHKKLILENNTNKISLGFKDLIKDVELMEQINSRDLISWLSLYYHQEAYKKFNDISTQCFEENNKKINNVVNLYNYQRG